MYRAGTLTGGHEKGIMEVVAYALTLHSLYDFSTQSPSLGKCTVQVFLKEEDKGNICYFLLGRAAETLQNL